MKAPHLLGVLCAGIFGIISMSALAAAVSGQGTWETTLQGRDLDGDQTTAEAYYDTVLGITWLADANVNSFMTWEDANAWVVSLDFGAGINNWRLPTMIDNGNDGCNLAYTGTDCGYNVQQGRASTSVYSEMASIFYHTLGNKAWADTSGNGPQSAWGLTNTGPFVNVQSDYYWSSTEYAPDTRGAWGFTFYDGNQDYASKDNNFHYAWAVHSGDVGTARIHTVTHCGEVGRQWLIWSDQEGQVASALFRCITPSSVLHGISWNVTELLGISIQYTWVTVGNSDLAVSNLTYINSYIVAPVLELLVTSQE